MNKVIKMQKIKSDIKDLQKEIEKEFHARVIGVFGSYARGQQKEKSDLDILVKFFEGATLFDFIGLAEYLEDKLSLKVDIVSERAVRPEIKDEIFKQVIKV